MLCMMFNTVRLSGRRPTAVDHQSRRLPGSDINVEYIDDTDTLPDPTEDEGVHLLTWL